MTWLEFGLAFLFGALAGYIFARVKYAEKPSGIAGGSGRPREKDNR